MKGDAPSAPQRAALRRIKERVLAERVRTARTHGRDDRAARRGRIVKPMPPSTRAIRRRMTAKSRPRFYLQIIGRVR